jgi:hypothetical protein
MLLNVDRPDSTLTKLLGSGRAVDLHDRIVSELLRTPAGLTRPQLFARLCSCNLSRISFVRTLAVLRETGRAYVRTERRGRRGPKTEIWFAAANFPGRAK